MFSRGRRLPSHTGPGTKDRWHPWFGGGGRPLRHIILIIDETRLRGTDGGSQNPDRTKPAFRRGR
jgi:hypothetical protein